MEEKISLFQNFRTLTNPSVFNSLCDSLESIKVRNHFSDAIQNLLKEASEQFGKDGYSSADKIFKLICELGCTTPAMRHILVFAAYNGIWQYLKEDVVVDLLHGDPQNEIDMIMLNDEAISNWIKEFCKIISKEKLPELIKQIEKIGFERS